MKKPWEPALPILLIPESTPMHVIEAMSAAQPGDFIMVPDDFHFIEIDPTKLTVKERGFAFQLTHEGLKRLK